MKKLEERGTLGKLLFLARLKQGKIQQEFAEKFEVSVTSINFWESQKTLPPSNKIALVSSVYQLDLDLVTKAYSEASKTPRHQKSKKGEFKKASINTPKKRCRGGSSVNDTDFYISSN